MNHLSPNCFSTQITNSFSNLHNNRDSMGDLNSNRIGYKWRSSKWFIVATVTIALFIGLSLFFLPCFSATCLLDNR